MCSLRLARQHEFLLCRAFLDVRADARIRTADPFITSEVLYQLSYVGVDSDSSRLRGNSPLRARDLRVASCAALPRMFLRPSSLELDAFRDQYDALVADLEAQGLEVELVGPEEYRSGLPEYDRRYSVSVYVGQTAATLHSVGVLVGTVREHLRGGARRRARLGCIQLPDGQKHEFRLPEG